MRPSFSTIGDYAHIFSIIVTLSFALSVAFFSQSNFFDSEWQRDGFCITNANVPYWTSHDVCLYVDAIMSLVVVLMYLVLHHKPGTDGVSAVIIGNTFGILGHGMGHGFMALRRRGGEVESTGTRPLHLYGDDYKKAIFYIPLHVIFWLAILKGLMHQFNTKQLAMTALVAKLVCTFVYHQFQFAYGQTVIMGAVSLNEIMRPTKEKETFKYAIFSIGLGAPVTLVGWLESTKCSSPLLQALQGHVIYDAYIPIAMLVLYFISYKNQSRLHKEKQV